MRVSIRKSTREFLEMQSAATEGTLIKNAVANGIPEDDVEEREVDQAGYAAILAAQPVAPEYAARQRLLELDALLKLRGIREGLVGLFAWMDYLRSIPEGLDSAGVVAYLRALPTPGTGAAKLKQVDDLCAEVRKVLAPK